jgi:serine protease Do
MISSALIWTVVRSNFALSLSSWICLHGLLSWTALAQSAGAPELLLAEQIAFQNAVAAVAPSVVQIETFGGMQRPGEQASADGPITGTIVGEEGWIVSSLYGLSQQPASILVNLPGGNRAPARIVAKDYARQIVLLKVDSDQPLAVASSSQPSEWRVGQWCIAIGKTYDPGSVTQSIGIISALGRAYGRAVQTDAKVSPINYGGPLIDLQGQVIGILAPVAAGEMLGDDGTVLYDSGIGFAVPLTDILQRLPQMQSGKDIRPGRLGIVTDDPNEMGGPVKLTGAAPGSPAARAGVEAGDIIVSGMGRPVHLLADLKHRLAEVDAGETFRFEVDRKGERVALSCDLVAEIPVYRRRYLGIRVTESPDGLKIESVVDASPASTAGLSSGQWITHCQQQVINRRSDLEQMIAVAELQTPIEFRVAPSLEQESVSIEVTPTEWPSELIQHEPKRTVDADEGEKEEESPAVEMLDLKLADIPNKIQALVPKIAQGQRYGCLLVYGEPGEVNLDKTKSAWQQIAADYGWIVVFPASANPMAWSRDEVELASRLLGKMDQEYSIDRSRSAIGGFGVGGQMALLAGITERQRVSGIFTVGTKIQSFGLRQPSAPLQTLDFLFVGDRQLESVADQLNRLGYAANWISTPDWDGEDWDAVPMAAIGRWLELLDYL